MVLNEKGECVYGERDRVDLEKIRQIGVPFWLAGGYGTPEKLVEAMELGAAGVQVGTAFAFCEESGLRPDYKSALIQKIKRGEASVFTDPLSSPTGFPFKAAQLEGTTSEAEVYVIRKRICDIGVLREAYRTDSGTIAYRCPSEPENVYIAKGGVFEETAGTQMPVQLPAGKHRPATGAARRQRGTGHGDERRRPGRGSALSFRERGILLGCDGRQDAGEPGSGARCLHGSGGPAR